MRIIQSLSLCLFLLFVPARFADAAPRPPNYIVIFGDDLGYGDIAESMNVAADHPQVVAQIEKMAQRARADLGDRGQAGAHQRPAGHVSDPRPLTR